MGFRNGNSEPSVFFWRARNAEQGWALIKLEGKLLPFLNPILLEHSIADKWASLLSRDCTFSGIRRFLSFSPFPDLNPTLKSGSTQQLTEGFPNGHKSDKKFFQKFNFTTYQGWPEKCSNCSGWPSEIVFSPEKIFLNNLSLYQASFSPETPWMVTQSSHAWQTAEDAECIRKRKRGRSEKPNHFWVRYHERRRVGLFDPECNHG